MATQSRDVLKEYFEVNDIPREWQQAVIDPASVAHGSLADLVGFDKKPVKLGKLAYILGIYCQIILIKGKNNFYR